MFSSFTCTSSRFVLLLGCVVLLLMIVFYCFANLLLFLRLSFNVLFCRSVIVFKTKFQNNKILSGEFKSPLMPGIKGGYCGLSRGPIARVNQHFRDIGEKDSPFMYCIILANF